MHREDFYKSFRNDVLIIPGNGLVSPGREREQPIGVVVTMWYGVMAIITWRYKTQ